MKKKIKTLSISKESLFLIKIFSKGVQLFPYSVVHNNSYVGDYSILNTGSVLEHDCKVGNGVHLMPGSVVGGNTIIEDYATVGMNATIMPKVKLAKGHLLEREQL